MIENPVSTTINRIYPEIKPRSGKNTGISPRAFDAGKRSIHPPNEINQVFKQRKTLRNFCLHLLKGSQNLIAAASKIRAWRYNIELAAKAYEAFKIGGTQRQREEYRNAISQINDMLEAKANMQKMMNLMNTAVQRFKLPFVTQMVSMYTSIFNELCRFCDKVADYAKKLEREAEKVLGPKSGWNRVFQKNSAYSLNKAGNTDSSITLDSTF